MNARTHDPTMQRIEPGALAKNLKSAARARASSYNDSSIDRSLLSCLDNQEHIERGLPQVKRNSVQLDGKSEVQGENRWN